MTFYDEQFENNDEFTDEITDDWGEIEEINTNKIPNEEEMTKFINERKENYEYLNPKHREVINCIICSEDVNHNDNHKKTSCGHTFHKDCFECWSNISKTCPYCKKYLKN